MARLQSDALKVRGVLLDLVDVTTVCFRGKSGSSSGCRRAFAEAERIKTLTPFGILEIQFNTYKNTRILFPVLQVVVHIVDKICPKYQKNTKERAD